MHRAANDLRAPNGVTYQSVVAREVAQSLIQFKSPKNHHSLASQVCNNALHKSIAVVPIKLETFGGIIGGIFLKQKTRIKQRRCLPSTLRRTRPPRPCFNQSQIILQTRTAYGFSGFFNA
jgi:hypothetical protein